MNTLPRPPIFTAPSTGERIFEIRRYLEILVDELEHGGEIRDREIGEKISALEDSALAVDQLGDGTVRIS